MTLRIKGTSYIDMRDRRIRQERLRRCERETIRTQDPDTRSRELAAATSTAPTRAVEGSYDLQNWSRYRKRIRPKCMKRG